MSITRSESLVEGGPLPSVAGRSAAAYLAVLLSVLAAGLSAVAAGNWWLDGLNFDRASQRHVAHHLAEGRNWAVFHPNIDLRAIRREQVALLPRAPEVAIMGASRFEVVDKEAFPGRSFLNLLIYNDYFEDMLAVTELLHRHGRLPRTLVLSVRDKTFLPPALRPTEEWKMFGPEYRAAADRLGLPAVALLDGLPLAHWGNLLSIGHLARQAGLHWQHRAAPVGPTDEMVLPALEVLRADGSLGFARRRSAAFTAEAARRDALEQAAAARQAGPLRLDPERLAALAPLLRFLVGQGVQAVIAISPHHPLYWDGIDGSAFGDSLRRLEAAVHAIAAAEGAVVVGGFDPVEAGCGETSFRDYIHVDAKCLTGIFDRIPVLPRGG